VTSSGFPVGAKQYIFGTGSTPGRNCLGVASTCLGSPVNAELEHVGRLLPVWHEIAHVVACAIHPQSPLIKMRQAILLHGPHGAGKRVAARSAAAALGCHFISISCEDIRPDGMPDDKVVETLDAVMNIAGQYKPVILLLRDVQLLAQPGATHQSVQSQGARIGAALANCIAKGLEGKYGEDNDQFPYGRNALADGAFPRPIFTIATVPDPDDVDAGIRRCFTHEIAADAPDATGRRMLLESFLSSASRECSIGKKEIESMVQHTAGLLPLELKNVAAEAYAAAVYPVHAKNKDSADEKSFVDVPDMDQTHVDTSIVSVRHKTASDIGAPKIPNVLWDDVGGLEDVKIGILDTVELPLKHPELFSGGLRRRSGVLLYGPPGTGKTLLAKAVATECSVNFLSVKGPELINMYVGESERLIRDVFVRARRARPCVIFFDELDSLAPARGKGSDSGGIMDRIVSQLLAEIDSAQGGSGSDDVFIVGATNRPDLLDPALLRPGRLDKLLYVGIASEPTDREKVIRALTRKFELNQDVDFAAVSRACSSRLTGADMYGMCSRAWMRAFKRHVNREKAESPRRDKLDSVIVAQQDFMFAAATVQPSLSEEDIQQYESLRRQS
jgi:peroxin-6